MKIFFDDISITDFKFEVVPAWAASKWSVELQISQCSRCSHQGVGTSVSVTVNTVNIQDLSEIITKCCLMKVIFDNISITHFKLLVLLVRAARNWSVEFQVGQCSCCSYQGVSTTVSVNSVNTVNTSLKLVLKISENSKVPFHHVRHVVETIIYFAITQQFDFIPSSAARPLNW